MTSVFFKPDGRSNINMEILTPLVRDMLRDLINGSLKTQNLAKDILDLLNALDELDEEMSKLIRKNHATEMVEIS